MRRRIVYGRAGPTINPLFVTSLSTGLYYSAILCARVWLISCKGSQVIAYNPAYGLYYPLALPLVMIVCNARSMSTSTRWIRSSQAAERRFEWNQGSGKDAQACGAWQGEKMAELEWVLRQDEGQFFDRKSCYDRSGGKVKRRSVREVAKDVAETLSAMANADGGVLALGIEDDGTVSGIDFPDDRLQVLRRAPETHVKPPLRAVARMGAMGDNQILTYEVDWSSDVHQLTDGRYLLRVGDQNMPFPAGDIEAIKEGKRRRVTEARFLAEATLDDLDMGLVMQLAERTGLDGSPEEALIRYRVAERRNGRMVLEFAALLLFGKDPGHWHARCGIDFVKYEGTERRVGAALNIV